MSKDPRPSKYCWESLVISGHLRSFESSGKGRFLPSPRSSATIFSAPPGAGLGCRLLPERLLLELRADPTDPGPGGEFRQTGVIGVGRMEGMYDWRFIPLVPS